MQQHYQDFILEVQKLSPNPLHNDKLDILQHAFEYGVRAHAGQTRANGKEYFYEHCVAVALKIASLGFDSTVIAAGLLHDTIEDTDTTMDSLSAEFSAEIATLVEGVSKLGKLKYKGNERHVESLRKFFLAIASDVRVIVIKLCDRWHNLETLEHLPPEKRQRIAQESIAIHAQLASRLGIGKLVTILNDLAFPYAFPDEYKKTKDLLESRLRDEEEIIKKLYRNVLAETTTTLGYQPTIDKRVKGIYSLYRKLLRKNWMIDDVFDIIALRVIVKEPSDCYIALGVVHAHYKPVPGRVKDYIALPKPNGYQSLHTSVFSGKGPIVEIQIRTEQMHAYNEFGIASHLLYKMSQEGAVAPSSANWLSQLEEFQKTELTPADYMAELTTDFFHDRIFVLTPEGDVVDLPLGATVLDFAYAIHTDLGDSAVGGRMDGKFVALKTPLLSEKIVEIVTDKRNKPSKKWLEWVITNHAKNKIRRRLSKSVVLS